MPIDIANMIVNIKAAQNFDWGNFWIALGSIATSCACIIALWQTKYSSLKKIKLKYGTAIGVDPLNQATNYISLDVINTGNRPIIINQWYMPLCGEKKLLFLTNLTPISAQLPKKLDLEESIDLYHDLEKFKLALQTYLEEGLLKNNSKIIFKIKDSTGKVYQVATNKRVKDFLQSNKKGGE